MLTERIFFPLGFAFDIREAQRYNRKQSEIFPKGYIHMEQNNQTEQTPHSSEYRGNFTVSKGENIRFNLLMVRKNIAISVTLLFTAVTVIRIFQQMKEGLPFFPALFSALPMALLCAILVPSLQLSSTALSIAMLYRQGKARAFSQEILLNDEGMFASSSHGTSKVVWKNMVFVRETPFDFFLFYSDKNAFILPKKQMQSLAEECESIRSVLRGHLPEDRLKLRG